MQHCKHVIFLLLLIAGLEVVAQPEQEGVPRSFRLKSTATTIATLQITSPDADSLAVQDNKAALHEKPYRIGITLPVEITPGKTGSWSDLPEGGRMWMLRLQCSGAKALGLYYKKFVIPEGADLYIYNQDKSQVIGAFTHENNSEEGYATRPVAGDEIILEYYQPASVSQQPDLQITGLMYAYRSTSLFTWKPDDAFNTSGTCEVNINCPEGANWKNQKRGVFLILSLVNGSNYLCTGTLMNNSSMNFDQLVLTANHCAEDNTGTKYSTKADFNQYIFYINYESAACTNPITIPSYQSFVGSKKLASTHLIAGGDLGSDFLLVRLNNVIPESNRPYYNGWSSEDVPSVSGVCIHHPEGDIKKISTYKTIAQSAKWETKPDTHWLVTWAATASGHGVTEGGSSGCPLFNSSGLVVGTLTGGDSFCSTPTAGDYFGKFSYSFTQNGLADSLRLKPWLDPSNLGLKSLSGSYKTLSPLGEFKADTNIIPLDGLANFTDLSLGMPTSWHWFFPGAETPESTVANPGNIRYNSYGTFDVTLIVANQYGSDTIVKKNYLQVNAHLYPNPTTGIINLLKGNEGPANFEVEIRDPIGRKVFYQNYQNYTSPFIQMDLSVYRGNIFFLTMRSGSKTETYKVIVVRQNSLD